MRLGILSDTHDRLERTHVAVQLLRQEGAEVLFHCGDVTSAHIIKACAVLPCYFTFGNNDADTMPELQEAATACGAICLGWGEVVELAGRRIGLVHGHLSFDVRRILAQNPDYVFSGHSHVKNDTQAGSIRRINPGALHRAPEFTVAILDLATEGLRFLTVPR